MKQDPLSHVLKRTSIHELKQTHTNRMSKVVKVHKDPTTEDQYLLDSLPHHSWNYLLDPTQEVISPTRHDELNVNTVNERVRQGVPFQWHCLISHSIFLFKTETL